MVVEEGHSTVALCDRGTVDGAAYWPLGVDDFWRELGTTREAEYARYAAVIHLRTPGASQGYNGKNPIRTETAQQALVIDESIFQIWSGHPHLIVVNSHDEFLEKANRTLAIIQKELVEGTKSLEHTGGTL
jgi:hypothetical protein